MSEELTRSEQLLVWDLFAAGGAKLLKDIVPKPKGAQNTLAARGFLTNSTHGRTRLLELEDRGWRWIADSDPFPIGPDERKVSAERRLLRELMSAIRRYATQHGRTIQELFRVEPKVPPRPERKPTEKARRRRVAGAVAKRGARDLAGEVRDAFFALAGKPPRDGVRLSALRDKLQGVARDDLDRTLLAMRKAGEANLMNLDNPRDIEGEREAELHAGRHVFHLVWIEA